MGTVDLLALITDARALGLALTTNGDKLNVTGPKTSEAAALVQQLAQHKAAVIELLRTPLPPMRMVSTRPPLPAEMWLAGLTFADALAAHGRLKVDYFCTVGHEAGAYFVRCDPRHYRVVTA